MTGLARPDLAQKRCRNHIERQAACRCPGCGYDFCRECVTEHEERLLCSRCVAGLAAAGAGKRRRSRMLSSVGLGLVGIVTAWVFFFLAGELFSTALAPRHEVRAWHAR